MILPLRFDRLRVLTPGDPNSQLAMLNGASAFGRLVANWLADRYGPFNVLVPSCLFSGALIIAMLGVTSSAALVVVSLLYGFFSGACECICDDTRTLLTRYCICSLIPDRRANCSPFRECFGDRVSISRPGPKTLLMKSLSRAASGREWHSPRSASQHSLLRQFRGNC
jgi:hypothetical protein